MISVPRARVSWAMLTALTVSGAAGAESRPPAPAARAAAGLDRGLELLQEGEHTEAAAALYGALSASRLGDGRHERVQFHLARALRELGLHLAADELLAAVIGNRTVPELVPSALGLLLEDLERGRADEWFVQSVLLDMDVGTLAGEHADAVAYHQGLQDLRQGQLRWGETGFRAVSGARYVHRTALALGAFHLTRGDVETARRSFRRVADAKEAPAEVRSLAVLSLARLAADGGLAKGERATLEEARDLYAKVGRPYAVSADVLLERAWLDFQLGDPRRALGFLLALDAPDYRDRLLPDKYVLRALIYSHACHYRAARQAALQLPRDFAAVADAVQRRQDARQSAALRRVLAKEPAVAPLEDLRGRIVAQRAAFGDVEDHPKLTRWLEGVYARLLDDVDRRLGAAQAEALPDIGRALIDAVADLRVVNFELALKLHRRVRGETVARSERLGAAPPIPWGGDKVFFPFEGESAADYEFWADELSDLVVYLEDRCVE